MANDAVVRAKDVLAAVMQLRRIGHRRALEELESLEPDLAEFAMEELTAIHHAFAATGLPHRTVRRLSRRAEAMVLVLITALRQARLRLWRETSSETTTPDGASEQVNPEAEQNESATNSAVVDCDRSEGQKE